MRREKGLLSSEIYKIVLENSPIATADLIVVRRNRGRREFLLGKRSDRPARGQWFIFGGKILKGERLRRAAARQLWRELGVKALSIAPIGDQDYFGTNNLGVRYHSIMHLHLARIGCRTKLKPNREHSAFRWFRRINPNWPAPVRKALKMAGFR